ncbi:MAG: DUF420 domain-containing protein [Deltaproteobacteria bacterium]|nr:MAG: DUF420 domain-containing protein [Deltaproteobacteria bacterium]
MTAADLPTLNATLNATATLLLLSGFFFIRRGAREAHRRCMIAATIVSALFLLSYVVYHAEAGSKPFPGTGGVRPLYYTILLTHILCAAAIVPLVPLTLLRARQGRFEAHRKLARITFPVWFYVSITGVVIYVMLYHLFPGN